MDLEHRLSRPGVRATTPGLSAYLPFCAGKGTPPHTRGRRLALGATRSRIVGQLFVEVLLIGAIAAFPGLMLAAGILSAYDRTLDELLQGREDPALRVRRT